MEKDKILRAVSRVLLLIKEPVLQQEPVTIMLCLTTITISNKRKGGNYVVRQTLLFRF